MQKNKNISEKSKNSKNSKNISEKNRCRIIRM